MRSGDMWEEYGTERADIVRHTFAASCRRQNIAPLPVMPAPYLFGAKEAGRVELRNKEIGDKMAIAVADGLQSMGEGCAVHVADFSGNRLTEAFIPAIHGLLTVHEVSAARTRYPLGCC